MTRKLTNVPASVRTRILALSKERNEENLYLLERYCLERLLFRLSTSPHRRRFILKGAMLFLVWKGSLHRPTRDLDLLGHGESSIKELINIFAEICSMDVDDDGIAFLSRTIKGEQIRPDDEYIGVRLKVAARVEAATLWLQVDVGFGDVVTVNPEEVSFPSLLGYPSPVLQAYPKETVIAEKVEAAIKLGILNSRLKDFYDIWFLANNFSFEREKLSDAIKATMERRGTSAGDGLPPAFGPQFGHDKEKIVQWKAFWTKSIKTEPAPSLIEVVNFIGEFLRPIFDTISAPQTKGTWNPKGPWLFP